MTTPLQKLYDRFQSKVDEDLTGKEGLIFALIDPAIAKSYKTCVHDLTYQSDIPIPPAIVSYDGSFNETLNEDEIELLALWMLYEWKRRKVSKLEAQRRNVGTADFNRLEDRAGILRELRLGMKEVLDEIDALKNEFNTYQY